MAASTGISVYFHHFHSHSINCRGSNVGFGTCQVFSPKRKHLFLPPCQSHSRGHKCTGIFYPLFYFCPSSSLGFYTCIHKHPKPCRVTQAQHWFLSHPTQLPRPCPLLQAEYIVEQLLITPLCGRVTCGWNAASKPKETSPKAWDTEMQHFQWN